MNTLDLVIPAKNPGVGFHECIRAWYGQQLPGNWSLHIFVVDDGSSNDIPARIAIEHPTGVTVLRNDTSLGRASAINRGADAGVGEYIAIVDADCLPVNAFILAEYICAIDSGSELAFGRLETAGQDFWARYFQEVSQRREARFLQGDHHALTTANCVIKRSLFNAAGKFNQRYRHYGFEDRDLIARMLCLCPRISYRSKAAVIHHDHLGLQVVCRKMHTAGRFSAGIFLEDHPQLYRTMPFSRADVRCGNKAKRILAPLLKPLLIPLTEIGVRLLDTPLPYGIKRLVVKVCSGLAFMIGTWDSASDARQAKPD